MRQYGRFNSGKKSGCWGILQPMAGERYMFSLYHPSELWLRQETARGAWAFLEYYISLVCEQKDILTTSKSQLQEQMEAWTITDRQNGDTERKSFVILDEVLEPVYGISREMAQQVMDLLKEADFSPDSRWKDDIAGIVLEEAEDFYKRNKSLEDVTEIIQNRAGILVQEQR